MIKIEAIVFDWGDTLMRNFPQYDGPMADWPEVEIMPGARETLAGLSRAFTLVVASNAGSSNAELVKRALKRGGIEGHFRFVFTGKELNSKKPELDFYRNICRKIGVPPGQCLMVGDNLEKDIIPARRVGMQAAWLTDKKEKPGDYWQIQSLPEVIEIVKRRAT